MAENLVESGLMRGVDRKICCVFFRGAVFFFAIAFGDWRGDGLEKVLFFFVGGSFFARELSCLPNLTISA